MKKKCLTLILSVLAFLGCMRMVVQAFPASAMIGIQNTLQEKQIGVGQLVAHRVLNTMEIQLAKVHLSIM